MSCAVLDRKKTFRLVARDRFNNIRDTGGDNFNAYIVPSGSVTMVRNEIEENEKREAEELEKKKAERKKRNEERALKGLPPEEESEDEKEKEKEQAKKEMEGYSSVVTEKQQQPQQQDKKEGEGEVVAAGTPLAETPSAVEDESKVTTETPKSEEGVSAGESGSNEDGSSRQKYRHKESEAEKKSREEREKKKKEKEEKEKKLKEGWQKLEQDLQRECLVAGSVQDLGTGHYEVSYVVSRELGMVAAEAGSYLLAVTLADGGLVRDAPFPLLLGEEDEGKKGDEEEEAKEGEEDVEKNNDDGAPASGVVPDDSTTG